MVKDFSAVIEGDFIIIESKESFFSMAREAVSLYGKSAIMFISRNEKELKLFIIGVGIVVIGVELLKIGAVITFLVGMGFYLKGFFTAYGNGMAVIVKEIMRNKGWK